MKLRKAPPGVEVVLKELEDFENKMREAVNSPIDKKMRNEMSWPVHKVHYQKNRYLYDQHYKKHQISKRLLDYLIKEGVADGKLIAKWRKPGYERLCSLLAITKSNTNFGTTSVCRVPLRDRHGQILPNIMTGCVSCASGDGGPIWWDDPVPEIAMQRALEADPGKAAEIQDTTPEEFEEARQEAAKAVEEEERLQNEETEAGGAQAVETVKEKDIPEENLEKNHAGNKESDGGVEEVNVAGEENEKELESEKPIT